MASAELIIFDKKSLSMETHERRKMFVLFSTVFTDFPKIGYPTIDILGIGFSKIFHGFKYVY